MWDGVETNTRVHVLNNAGIPPYPPGLVHKCLSIPSAYLSGSLVSPLRPPPLSPIQINYSSNLIRRHPSSLTLPYRKNSFEAPVEKNQ